MPSYQVTLADRTRYRVTLPTEEEPPLARGSQAATPLAAAPETPAEAPPSSSLGETATGVVAGLPEAALSIGTGMLNTPVAGWAGLLKILSGGSAEAAAKNIESTSEALTYEPRTAIGKGILDVAGKVLSLPSKAGRAIGEKFSDVTGSPAAAAAVGTATELTLAQLMLLPLGITLPRLAKYMPAKDAELLTGDINALKFAEGREKTTIERLARGEDIRRPPISEAPPAEMPPVWTGGVSEEGLGGVSVEEMARMAGGQKALFKLQSNGKLVEVHDPKFMDLPLKKGEGIIQVDPITHESRILTSGPETPFSDVAQRATPELFGGPGRTSAVEQWIRNRAQPKLTPIETLAKHDPNLIPAQLIQQEKDIELWKQASKQAGQPIAEPPPSPEFSTDKVVVRTPDKEGLLNILGTPISTADRLRNVEYGDALREIAIVEKAKHDAESRWNATDTKALTGIDQKRGIQIAEAYRGRSLDEALKRLPTELRPALQYTVGKLEDFRGMLQTHLRNLVRPQIKKEIERAVGSTTKVIPETSEIIERNIGRRVDEEVMKRIPDTWGIEDYLTQILPGDYLVIEKKTGHILGSASTPFARKILIRELTQDGKFSASDLTTTEKVHIDSDMFGLGRGRSALKIADEMSGLAKLSDEDIANAAQGDFSARAKTPFMPFILKRTGKASGYTNDLQFILKTYNRAVARWIALGPLAKKIAPAIEELEAKGFSVEANNLKAQLDILWGRRSDLGKRFDNTIQATPVLGQLVAPYALERWAGGLKKAIVATMIKYSPRFHAVNATQLFNTLWPITGADEIYTGMRMFGTKAGKEILSKYSIEGASKVESGLGPIEDFNQGTAFLTMYNRAVKLGLDSDAAADYAFLRGNLYSQFHALQTDRPTLFRKLDPTGTLTLFQRFSVKQIEQFADLLKDRNVSGAAKWLATIGLMGGARGLMFGGGGWLTYRAYKEISDEYGETVANTLHLGLPAFAGVDLSNTAMVYNPPMGKSLFEKIGYAAAGPIGSISSSVLGAMFNSKGVDPSVARRGVNALIQRLPVAKELDSVRRIMMDDYDLHDPAGKLKYTTDVKDLIRMSLGFRTVTEAKLTQLADSIVEARRKRDDVLDYAASRYGQAIITGIGLPQSMEEAIQKDVDSWNVRWPEMSITRNDIMVRARSRAEAGMVNLRQRMLKSARRVGRASEFRE